MGPRQSLKFRDNMSVGGRSPALQRRYIQFLMSAPHELLGSRVGSLTADDVISFTVSNYDDDYDSTEKDNAWLKR